MTHSKLVSPSYAQAVQDIRNHVSLMPSGQAVFTDLYRLEDALLLAVNSGVVASDTLEDCAACIAGTTQDANDTSLEAMGVKYFLSGMLGDLQETFSDERVSPTGHWVSSCLKRGDFASVIEGRERIAQDEKAAAALFLTLVMGWIRTAGGYQSDINAALGYWVKLLKGEEAGQPILGDLPIGL